MHVLLSFLQREVGGRLIEVAEQRVDTNPRRTRWDLVLPHNSRQDPLANS